MSVLSRPFRPAASVIGRCTIDAPDRVGASARTALARVEALWCDILYNRLLDQQVAHHAACRAFLVEQAATLDALAALMKPRPAKARLRHTLAFPVNRQFQGVRS